MLKRKLIYFCFSFLVICTVSCKKETIQGPKGDAGTPGGGGNAGISASGVFTVVSSQWEASADSSFWKFTIATPLITQDIVDKGVVKVFVRKGTTWWELPYTEGDLFTQFGFELGKANLSYADIHGGLPLKPVTAAYRVITVSAVARAANPKINWSNYEEVDQLINSNTNVE